MKDEVVIVESNNLWKFFSPLAEIQQHYYSPIPFTSVSFQNMFHEFVLYYASKAFVLIVIQKNMNSRVKKIPN